MLIFHLFPVFSQYRFQFFGFWKYPLNEQLKLRMRSQTFGVFVSFVKIQYSLHKSHKILRQVEIEKLIKVCISDTGFVG